MTTKSNYVAVPTDGVKDGGEGKDWVGPWFVAKSGTKYKVPANAANHTSLRGKMGVCRKSFVNSFGHSWAFIDFGGKPNVRRWIRTCYLAPVEKGVDVELVNADVSDATDPVQEKFHNVWHGGWNVEQKPLRGGFD